MAPTPVFKAADNDGLSTHALPKERDLQGGLLKTRLGPLGANELHMQILESGFDVGVVKLALCDIERLLREHDRVRLQLSPRARADLELAKRQNERVKHTAT